MLHFSIFFCYHLTFQQYYFHTFLPILCLTPRFYKCHIYCCASHYQIIYLSRKKCTNKQTKLLPILLNSVSCFSSERISFCKTIVVQRELHVTYMITSLCIFQLPQVSYSKTQSFQYIALNDGNDSNDGMYTLTHNLCSGETLLMLPEYHYVPQVSVTVPVQHLPVRRHCIFFCIGQIRKHSFSYTHISGNICTMSSCQRPELNILPLMWNAQSIFLSKFSRLILY